MFTGLVEATGRIESVEGTADGRRLVVRTTLGADLREGDSIAVSGVCLTATSVGATGFTADLARETLAVTSLADLAAGHFVNLERPVRADTRMGGHFVLGHVDGVARVTTWRADGDAHWLEVEIPDALTHLVVSKGSIAIDGISLTVARLDGARVGLQIIPFTRAHTTLASIAAGDRVNVEVDVLGKYVARLLAVQTDRPGSQVESLS